MPELPEVETVASDLRARLTGRRFVGVTINWQSSIARPAQEEFECQIMGRQVRTVSRRGKYVVFELDHGYLLVHLKMSGRLYLVPATQPLDRHLRVIFDLDNGHQMRFQDTRKFGRLYLVDAPEQVTAGLGPEPLADDLSLDVFRKLLARRTGRIKPLLLNQRFLAGLGNIYADESLFVARLHPLRRADSLTPAEQTALYRAIRTVLRGAVAGRGTTLSDGGYTDTSGQAGTFQHRIAVYGRTGEPCQRCQTAIQRIVLGGRSAHYCPICQVV